MKLSDVKGERTLEVIADIIDPVYNIATDEEAARLFKREKCPSGVTPKEFILKRIKSSLPAILKGHKSDIISILATIEGISAEEYSENLDLVKLLKDFTELLTDDMFMSLFISSPSGTGAQSSGSASENIAE